METFEDIKQKAREMAGCTLAVAGAMDARVITACAMAYREGICTSILVGKPEPIRELCIEHDYPAEGYEILPVEEPGQEALPAVNAVARGEAQALMKGKVKTRLLMKAVLSSLGRNRPLSHVFVARLPDGGFLFVSDGGMVIKPTIEEKRHITENAVEVARRLGITHPRVLILSHDGRVHPEEEVSVDGAVLSTMSRRGQIKDAEVFGPAPFDMAALPEYVDKEDLFTGFGDADIIIVPNIECGNILGKCIQHIAGFQTGLIVAGAECPIVLTSRVDSAETRLNSIALALAASPAV